MYLFSDSTISNSIIYLSAEKILIVQWCYSQYEKYQFYIVLKITSSMQKLLA